MSLQGFYTQKGAVLAAKLAAGTKLTVTKVTAGSGTTAAAAAALNSTKQTLPVGTAQTAAQTAILPVTLKETNAEVSYTLTELGVYASDPAEGEILYQVFRLDKPCGVTAGGEDTYRFYLKETVGAGGITVVNSAAGELLDEDLDALRGKVMAALPARRTVAVAAADLQTYLNTLPRMVNEMLTISVTSGTVSANLLLRGFYGSGNLTIKPAEGASVQFPLGISVEYCSIRVTLDGLTVSGEGANDGSSSKALIRFYASVGIVSNCTLTGNGSNRGVEFVYESKGMMISSSVTNTKEAVWVGIASVGTIRDCTGSGNTVGVMSTYGGIVTLSGSTPALMGGTTNTKDGPIFKAGALI